MHVVVVVAVDSVGDDGFRFENCLAATTFIPLSKRSSDCDLEMVELCTLVCVCVCAVRAYV